MGVKLSIIIAAGGSSRRYGSTDKLMEELDGLPVLFHAIRNMAPLALPGELVVVAAQEALENYRLLAGKLLPHVDIRFVSGGSSRQESVANGLQSLRARNGLVAVHDGARPLATAALLEKVAQRAQITGGAIAAVPVVDSIKRAGAGNIIAAPVDRSCLWRAETPQVFDIVKFRYAYSVLGDAEVTDDAEIMRLAGFPVELVDSAMHNMKLTAASDLPQLRLLYAGVKG